MTRPVRAERIPAYTKTSFGTYPAVSGAAKTQGMGCDGKNLLAYSKKDIDS